MFSARTMIPKSNNASSPVRRANTSNQNARSKPTPYPEFKEAAEYEDDVYWKRSLINASHGEFNSKLTVYTDGRLMRKDLPSSSVRVPRDNPEQAARIFVNFHKKYERTLSDSELERQVSRRHEVCSRPVTLTWSTTSIQMKRAALNYYAVNTCNKMQFTTAFDRGRSTRDLSATLLLALNMKLLDDTTVIMKNNVITSVTCVRYNSDSGCWIISNQASSMSSSIGGSLPSSPVVRRISTDAPVRRRSLNLKSSESSQTSDKTAQVEDNLRKFRCAVSSSDPAATRRRTIDHVGSHT